MDPKGDRLRKLKMGTLKLPESVLKSNNIILTSEPAKIGGGCLEGGARPRPVPSHSLEGSAAPSTAPIIIPTSKKGGRSSFPDIPLPSDADIPLPSDADIPLPSDADIPLPASNSLPADIPLPRDEDIPLPSNASIPLPADKPPNERRKIKVVLSHLEPRGDELLCRSCVMKFSRQLDYDIHLQSDAHQQAIKADLQEDKIHGGSLPIPRQDRKSPSNDSKSGTVSFTFKKNIGHRITSMQPFLRRDDKSDRNIGEIKVLRLEPETGMDKMTSGLSLVNSYGTEKDDSSDSNSMVGVKDSESKDKKLMCSFVKVHCKDDSGRLLDWPKEMIQYTHTEPKIMFSCNPLSFDFSQLFANKINKKSPAHSEGIMNAGDVKFEEVKDDTKEEGVEIAGKKEEEKKVVDGEKKKSHKKKKKKKHRKHKDKNEEKDGENKVEEISTSKKKKKKKHKKKNDDAEKNDDKGTEENQEKEKKKHKKSKKRKHQSEEEKGKENDAGEEEKKSKKRKHKKSKKKKKKHHQSDTEQEKSDGEKEAEKKNGEKKEESGSAEESDNEKDKNPKKKHKKKKKHSKKEGSNNSSESESEKTDKKPGIANDSHVQHTVENRKFHVADSDTESEKIVAKLQALNRTKNAQPVVANNSILQKKIKKEPIETDKRTPSERKRVNSESSVNEQTPTPSKKAKSIIKTPSGAKDKTPVTPVALLAGIKTDKNEESWSKIETQTQDNVKSKWDTSESDIEKPFDDVTNKQKILRKRKMLPGPVNKSLAAKGLKSPPVKPVAKVEPEHKKPVNASSQRSNLSNVSAGSSKKISIVEKYPVKTRRPSRSPASSHSSRSGSRSYRSYSRSSSRSRSRSYSSSSYYSDRSRHSKRRRRKRRRSSTVSYSSSSSRSRSRSRYNRHRSRSSSYSDYSRSRSYSSSRSRSRSRRKRRRSYSRGRSRSYSSSSYSSRSRSRSRSHRRRSRRKNRRKSKSVDRTLARSSIDVTKKTTKEEKEKPVESKKVDPSDIPLPDLSGKKDDELTKEKLQKLREKKPRTDVGETVAKLVESLPADIPLPYSEGSAKTVSSDSLPSGPPGELRKETDTGFIGPRLPPPPPPPPGHNMCPPRYPPNHGPPGPPRPGYGPGQWDPWDGRGHWDSHGPWDGPGPGPRPPYRGMRPPFDPRMRGPPYDHRMRGPPPHFMNRPPRGPYMGPRYPGPHGPPPEYDAQYTEDEPQEPPKKESPPPLPPPKAPSPKPPPPTKKEKEKEKEKEPEQNPDIVIPPEQAEQYKQLQKQAAKHARKQLRRQQKKELGEPEEDSSSSEEEQEEKQTIVVQAAEEEPVLVEEMQQQLVAVPQQMPLVLAQPQPASSPASYVVAVSSGQQILIQKQPSYLQAGVPIQAGQPVMAVSQAAMLASHAAATANAQPAHLVHTALGAPAGHLMAATPGVPTAVPVAMHSAASLQHLQQVQQVQQLQQLQHIQQVQQIQQIQQAQAIQAHNQAVAAAHAAQAAGPIVVGNQILVPRIGIRPAL